MRKRMVSVLICAVFVIGASGVSVSASNIEIGKEPGVITLRYTYLQSINPTLSMSSRTAGIGGTIRGYSDVTKINYSVTLQAKSGSTWTYVDAWSGTKAASMTTYSYNKSGLTSGTTYRTKTVATIYSGSNSETITAYSVERTA